MKCKRKEFIVDAVQYEIGSGLEDGFQLWSEVITNGYITTDNLVKITREDGSIVCPFIRNKRGLVFIRYGDYIISENGERHACGDEKFHDRYEPVAM